MITRFGNTCFDLSMASAALLASMQESKPSCSKSLRRAFRKELSLSTMSTVDKFPSLLGVTVDNPVECVTFSRLIGQRDDLRGAYN